MSVVWIDERRSRPERLLNAHRRARAATLNKRSDVIYTAGQRLERTPRINYWWLFDEFLLIGAVALVAILISL